MHVQVYVAMLQYLHWCGGPRLAGVPPLVLSKLLAGRGAGLTPAQLDAAFSELEAGNAQLLGNYR